MKKKISIFAYGDGEPKLSIKSQVYNLTHDVQTMGEFHSRQLARVLSDLETLAYDVGLQLVKPADEEESKDGVAEDRDNLETTLHDLRLRLDGYHKNVCSLLDELAPLVIKLSAHLVGGDHPAEESHGS